MRITKRTVGIQISHQFQTYKCESDIEFNEEESQDSAKIELLSIQEQARCRREATRQARIDFPQFRAAK